MSNKDDQLSSLIRASRKEHRIDVVDLAQRLGLDVYSVDMPENDCGDIQQDQETNKVYIEVNRNHPITRQRFTIAHEISHYLKHRDELTQKGKLDRKDQYSDAKELKLEAEADQTAAAILMPETVVEDYFTDKQWSKNTKFDPEMIEQIADDFWVSRTMAVTRLRDLGFPVPYLSFA